MCPRDKTAGAIWHCICLANSRLTAGRLSSWQWVLEQICSNAPASPLGVTPITFIPKTPMPRRPPWVYIAMVDIILAHRAHRWLRLVERHVLHSGVLCSSLIIFWILKVRLMEYFYLPIPCSRVALEGLFLEFLPVRYDSATFSWTRP